MIMVYLLNRRYSVWIVLVIVALLAGSGLTRLVARARKAPSVLDNPAILYSDAPTKEIFSPFDLHIDPMERLLLINFENDPDEIYVGFEPQVFDDDVHGQGMLVIAWRVDGRVDVYHQPGLTLDPDTYDIAGQGLAQMLARPLADARFEVRETGVDAYFAFEDTQGRPIEVTVLEGNRRTRKPFGLLAPMGNAATAPSALPLVMLHDFYFVRQADTLFSIQVAGQTRQPDTLPLPIDGARMYFTRYAPDPLIATLNPAHEGPLTPLARVNETTARAGEVWFDLVENQGQIEIAQMRRSYKDHEISVVFSPPIPNLVSLADGTQSNGVFTIIGDPTVGTVTGEYHLARQGDQIDMRVTPSGGWQPNEDKWSVRFIYWMASDFTEWPKTYLWMTTLDVTNPEQVTMTSGWQRTQ